MIMRNKSICWLGGMLSIMFALKSASNTSTVLPLAPYPPDEVMTLALIMGNVSSLLDYTRKTKKGTKRIFTDSDFLNRWGNKLFIRASTAGNVDFVRSFLYKFGMLLDVDTLRQAYRAAPESIRNLLRQLTKLLDTNDFQPDQKLKAEFYAALNGSGGTVRDFLEGFPIAERVKLVSTPLGPHHESAIFIAVRSRNLVAVKAVLDAGATVDLSVMLAALGTGDVSILTMMVQVYCDKNPLPPYAQSPQKQKVSSDINAVLSLLCLSDAPESVTMMQALSQVIISKGLQLDIDAHLVYEAIVRLPYRPKVIRLLIGPYASISSSLAIEKVELLFSLGLIASTIDMTDLSSILRSMLVVPPSILVKDGDMPLVFKKFTGHMDLVDYYAYEEKLFTTFVRLSGPSTARLVLYMILNGMGDEFDYYTELLRLPLFLRLCIIAGADVNADMMNIYLERLYPKFKGSGPVQNYLDIMQVLLSRATQAMKDKTAVLVALKGWGENRVAADRFRTSLFPLLIHAGADLNQALIDLPQVISGMNGSFVFAVKNLIAAGAQVTGDAAVQDGKSVLSELLQHYGDAMLTGNRRVDLEQALDIVLDHGARLTTDQQADPVLRHAAHQFLQNAGDKIVNTQLLLLYAQQLGDEAEVVRLTQRITQARSRGIGARVQRLLGVATDPAEEQQRQGGEQDTSNGHDDA